MTYLPKHLAVRCPVCDAAPGHKCRSLNQTAYRKVRSHPHSGRLSAVESTAEAARRMRASRPEQYSRYGPALPRTVDDEEEVYA